MSNRRINPDDVELADLDDLSDEEEAEVLSLVGMAEDAFMARVAQYAANPEEAGHRVLASGRLVERTYTALLNLKSRAEHRVASATTQASKEHAERDRKRYAQLWRDLRPLVAAARSRAVANTPRRRAEHIVLKVRYQELSGDLRFVMRCLENGMDEREAHQALVARRKQQTPA